jgi:hypothetical protein
MVALPLRIHAVFRDGKFIPTEPCLLPDASEVELVIQSSQKQEPSIADPDERRAALAQLVKDMQARPLAADAPKLTRDEMHERR